MKTRNCGELNNIVATYKINTLANTYDIKGLVDNPARGKLGNMLHLSCNDIFHFVYKWLMEAMCLINNWSLHNVS